MGQSRDLWGTAGAWTTGPQWSPTNRRGKLNSKVRGSAPSTQHCIPWAAAAVDLSRGAGGDGGSADAGDPADERSATVEDDLAVVIQCRHVVGERSNHTTCTSVAATWSAGQIWPAEPSPAQPGRSPSAPAPRGVERPALAGRRQWQRGAGRRSAGTPADRWSGR